MKTKILIIGGVIMDQYMLVDRFPEQGQDTYIKESFYRVGGCALNVAATIKNLGGDPYIVANIGSDYLGQEIEKYLRNHCYNLDCIRVSPMQSSGYSISLVEPSGERTFLTYKGCEEHFDMDMLHPSLLAQIGYVYLTGYYLLNPDVHSDILKALEQIKGLGGRVLFDPGPLVWEIKPEMLVAIFKLSDIITPNEVEYQQIVGMVAHEQPFSDWLFDHGVEWVIMKRGESGVQAKSKHKSISMPAFRVNTIDTTGAGDSFAGGLLYSLSHNLPMEQALRVGSACGALTSQMMGPHGSFTLNDVQQLISNNRRT